MLIASLALHAGLDFGIALAYCHGVGKLVAASTEVIKQPATLIMLQSEEAPAHQLQAKITNAVAQTVTAVTPAGVPVPAQPVVKKPLGIAAVTPLTALTKEANPNAHIAPLPPEAVLSPNPAPHLNGANAVVFILDISGSMYEPYAGSTRLAFARQTLASQIRALKDGTPFAVTLYAQHARNSGPLVAANNATREAAVRFLTNDVDCGGGTNLPAGLSSAQQLHAGSLVLVSDGDLNISAASLAAQSLAILGDKSHCPALSIVGIAPRPSTGDEELLQSLADQQGGSYRYVQPEGNSNLVTSASGAIKPASVTP
jgi:hypothetical protein